MVSLLLAWPPVTALGAVQLSLYSPQPGRMSEPDTTLPLAAKVFGASLCQAAGGEVFSEAVTSVKAPAAAGDGRVAGCVRGTIPAGGWGCAHVSARCWETRRVSRRGGRRGGGGGELCVGEQLLHLHSHSGPARSVQTLVKSCREPGGDGAGARTLSRASKAGREPEMQWVEFAGERAHLFFLLFLNN